MNDPHLKVLGFRTDTGWEAEPGMRSLPSEVYSKQKPSRVNVQDVVDRHLKDASMFPLKGMKGHTITQDVGE